jgi:hypothetical protein
MNTQDYLGGYMDRFTRLRDRANELGLQGEERSAFLTGAPTGSSEIDTFVNYIRERDNPENMRQKLQVASEFDKERMAEAAKYKALFDLPKTIMEGITGPSKIAAEGSRGIASSMMMAGQQIPQLVNYTPRSGYSYTPSRYYS